MTNAGYLIIKIERYHNRYAIVLGQNKNNQYVTWDCILDENSFFWGHYFNDRETALKDFHTRLAKEYDSIIQYKKEPV